MFRPPVVAIFREVFLEGYILHRPGIECRWGGRDFPRPCSPALGRTQPSV